MRQIFYVVALMSSAFFCADEARGYQYAITDLGTLGLDPSAGNSINAEGKVAGYSYVPGETVGHAFLYDGTMHDLGKLGGADSVGNGINDIGHVVGSSDTINADERHAFLYDGTLHDLGTLGGQSISEGNGINSTGEVTGLSYTLGGTSHTFLWKPTVPNGNSGVMYDLGTLSTGPNPSSTGIGINSSGQVTGASETADRTSHAFVWSPVSVNGTTGTMHDLGTLGGSQSAGQNINSNGQVVGYSFMTDAQFHAFLWSPTTPNGVTGTMKDLGASFGGSLSNAYGINDVGQVTGYADLPGDRAGHAFLFSELTGMVDLNSLIDPNSGWVLQNATGINDAGQITGYGDIGVESHAFLLTPVSEPSGLALLTLASFAIAGFRPFKRYGCFLDAVTKT